MPFPKKTTYSNWGWGAQGPSQFGLMADNSDSHSRELVPGWPKFFQACFLKKKMWFNSLHHNPLVNSFLTSKCKGLKKSSSPTISSLFIPCYPLQMNPAEPNFPVVWWKLEKSIPWHVISGLMQATSALLLLLSWPFHLLVSLFGIWAQGTPIFSVKARELGQLNLGYVIYLKLLVVKWCP